LAFLRFEEEDVVESHADDGVEGGGEGWGEGVGILGGLVEQASGLVRVLEGAAGAGVEQVRQLVEGDVGDGGDVRELREDEGGSGAEGIGERLEALVVGGEEEERAEAEGFFSGEGVDETGIGAREEAEGEIAFVEGEEVFDGGVFVEAGDEGDVVGVGLVVFGKGLAEVFDVGGVEEGEAEVERGEVRVGSEVVEGMPPVDAGRLTDSSEVRDVEVSQVRDELLLEGEEAGVVVVEGEMREEPGLIRGLEADVEAVEREVKGEKVLIGRTVFHSNTSFGSAGDEESPLAGSVAQGHTRGGPLATASY
jgi:hypothetical protein